MNKRDKSSYQDAKDMFDWTASVEEENRDNAEKDIRFSRLSEQWPRDILESRRKKGQICLTINRLPSFIRQVVNNARMKKPQIKIHPVDDKGDKDTANVMNGLIRNIEYTSSADVAYDTGVESAVTAGYGYWTIGTDYANDDTFDMDIKINRVANIFSIYGDPESTAADSSDWNSAFVLDTVSESDFEKKYGKKARKIDWGGESGLTLKKGRHAGMTRNKGVVLAKWWQRHEGSKIILELTNGEVIEAESYMEIAHDLASSGIHVHKERTVKTHDVTVSTLSGAEILDQEDWPGIYIPIIPVYGDEVVVDDKRHFLSFIRDAKDPQRMLNFWRTQSTQLVALAPNAPYIGRKNSFQSDKYKWETAHKESWAYIQYDGDVPPVRQGFTGPPAGAIQEALNASDDIKSVLGLFDASLGARSNETSGRAIEARQREGDTSTFHFSDNHVRAIQHTGRVLIDLIPKIYSGKRMIRILGDRGTDPKVVPIGPSPEQAQMPSQSEMGLAGFAPNTAQGGDQDAFTDEAEPEKIYDLTLGKYDLVVSAGKDYQTQRLESADEMFKFLEYFPQAAPYIGHILAMNLDWPGAEEIAEQLKKMVPGYQDGGQQIQAQIQQLEQKVNDKVALDQQKIDVQSFDAQTKRLQSLLPMMTTDEVSDQVSKIINNEVQS
ncbi:MAG: hypothetical protein JAZ11_13865 [Candidatus Thiodiazotropha lotti]|nr:hypothetical protein [Candidatus Thiodiazotropha lotti]